LKQHAVAYFNSDGNGRGFFHAGGSHSLENFINSVAKDVDDPETKMSVWKRARLAARLHGTPESRAEAKSRPDSRISALGSGSDYTVFIDHLGVPSANLGYGGEDEGGGQYHSVYDDFYYYTHFQDTEFVYERALAQTAGTMMMRMADADVLPYQFTDQADTIHTYVTEVKKLADTMRTQIKDRNADLADGVYKAATDPKKTSVPPPVDVVPPYFNFAPLDQASDDLTAAAADYEKAFTAHAENADPKVNALLIATEHALTDPAGLPNRPWFENMIYAPGFFTGYGVKTLPAVRESIEQKQWTAVDPQISRTAAAIEREVDKLKAATTALNGE
jgi:N-acetylated-alpha-linked acidic dipeptidase